MGIVPTQSNNDVIMAGFNLLQRGRNAEAEWLTNVLNADRTSVEWCFGAVCNKFKWVENRDANKIGLTACGMYYLVSIFFTNRITCLRGGNIHYERFGISPPTLAEYLNL